MDLAYSEDSIRKYFVKIPKVELHAHLNGSISQNTLKRLIEMKNVRSDNKGQVLRIPELSSNGLSQCFELFSLIHTITDNPEAIYLATCDVIEDFYKDGVSYLELRTTPREVDSSMTQDIYVETVLKAINDTCHKLDDEIDVRLLLSIDRKKPLMDAQKTLKIAEQFCVSSNKIIGLDFSGDPSKGDVSSFIPVLESAKKEGLKLAVHIAEVPNNFEEVEILLNLQPDRLGHGTFLLPERNQSIKNFDMCKRFSIPLEICLTSNIISKTVSSYEDHHFKSFMNMGYPCVLCTDDKGIFNTTLSNEYYLAHKYYSLSKENLYSLSFDSINYIFADFEVKQKLKKIWKQKILQL